MKKLLVVLVAVLNLDAAGVVGQGFLKTQGGEVRTCAGNAVYIERYNEKNDNSYVLKLALLKLTNELVENQLALNGQSDGATVSKLIAMQNEIKTINKSKVLAGETICDAQGNFEFSNIAPGMYIIGTTVEWLVGKEKQGGFIYTKFEATKEKKKVFITK